MKEYADFKGQNGSWERFLLWWLTI